MSVPVLSGKPGRRVRLPAALAHFPLVGENGEHAGVPEVKDVIAGNRRWSQASRTTLYDRFSTLATEAPHVLQGAHVWYHSTLTR